MVKLPIVMAKSLHDSGSYPSVLVTAIGFILKYMYM